MNYIYIISYIDQMKVVWYFCEKNIIPIGRANGFTKQQSWRIAKFRLEKFNISQNNYENKGAGGYSFLGLFFNFSIQNFEEIQLEFLLKNQLDTLDSIKNMLFFFRITIFILHPHLG